MPHCLLTTVNYTVPCLSSLPPFNGLEAAFHIWKEMAPGSWRQTKERKWGEARWDGQPSEAAVDVFASECFKGSQSRAIHFRMQCFPAEMQTSSLDHSGLSVGAYMIEPSSQKCTPFHITLAVKGKLEAFCPTWWFSKSHASPPLHLTAQAYYIRKLCQIGPRVWRAPAVERWVECLQPETRSVPDALAWNCPCWSIVKGVWPAEHHHQMAKYSPFHTCISF